MNTYQLNTKNYNTPTKKGQIFIKTKDTQIAKPRYNPQKTLKNPRLYIYMWVHERNQRNIKAAASEERYG